MITIRDKHFSVRQICQKEVDLERIAGSSIFFTMIWQAQSRYLRLRIMKSRNEE